MGTSPKRSPTLTQRPPGERGDGEDEDEDVSSVPELTAGPNRKHVRHAEGPASATAAHVELPVPNAQPHSVRHDCGGTERDQTRGLWTMRESKFWMSMASGSASPRSAFAAARESSSAR